MVNKLRCVENVREILEYYSSRRGVGHTDAMVDGAKHTDGVIVITNNSSMPTILRGKLKKAEIFTCDSDLERMLLGRDKPLVLDNAAVVELFSGVLDIIADLEATIRGLMFMKKTPQASAAYVKESVADIVSTALVAGNVRDAEGTLDTSSRSYWELSTRLDELNKYIDSHL